MRILLLILAVYAGSALSATFSANTPYQVCFTPGGDCTNLLVKTIDQAKKSILVQGYSFTSAPIAHAIGEAKVRGVNVKVILDKSQLSQRYTIVTYLKNHEIPVWIDYKPAIAHNKIFIIDDHIVETGSFNFTKAAQMRNAENMLIIDSSALAKLYTQNWLNRQSVSRLV